MPLTANERCPLTVATKKQETAEVVVFMFVGHTTCPPGKIAVEPYLKLNGGVATVTALDVLNEDPAACDILAVTDET